MSDELRQAAERLYEYVTREIDDFTDEAAELDEDMGEELRQVLRDTLKLARNYLAEHPADGDELARADAKYVLRWILQCHEYGVHKLPGNIHGLATRALELWGEAVRSEIDPPTG